MGVRQTKALRAFFAAILSSMLVLGVWAFSTPQVFAASPPSFCDLQAYYIPPAIGTGSYSIVYSVASKALIVEFEACDTHDLSGPYIYRVWVEPGSQQFSISSSQRVKDFSYPRPLIPAASYTFWVAQCFTDGSCTSWSQPETGAFPLHHF